MLKHRTWGPLHGPHDVVGILITVALFFMRYSSVIIKYVEGRQAVGFMIIDVNFPQKVKL